MSDEMDIDAALQALEHIKSTLSSYRGLEPRKEVSDEPSEESTEEAPEVALEIEAEAPEELEAESKEPPAMRILDIGGSSKPPKSEPPPASFKRGPGRPKKVR